MIGLMRSDEGAMDSPKKPSLVRRGFVIVLALTLLLCFLAVVIPNQMRSMKSTKSTQILSDLRMLDAAIDRYVMEDGGGASLSSSPELHESGPAETVDSLKLAPSLDAKGILEQMEQPPVIIMSSSKSYVLPGALGVESLLKKEGDKPQAIMPSSKSGPVVAPGTVQALGDELSRIINRPQSPPQPPAK